MKKKKQQHDKHFCLHCLKSFKRRGGGSCEPGHKVIQIWHKFHLPSMRASRSRWRQFFRESGFLQTGYMNEPGARELLEQTIENL